MATYDSAWMLAALNREAGRPSTDEITDPDKYLRLSVAQQWVIVGLAHYVPGSSISTSGPVALTTADSKVFTFGTDANSYPIAPIGHVAVGTSLDSFPDGDYLEGPDFTNEGTQIRLTNNRSYSGTLYAQWTGTPADISASTQPTLRPAWARPLIVYQAAKDFAGEGARNAALYDAMSAKYDEMWMRLLLAVRTQFRRADPWRSQRASYRGGLWPRG